MAKLSKRRGRDQIRIIGGEWRGRRLDIVPHPGLRPTADRIRETLFNWLVTSVPRAHCADLFAGTGALGLEALSRGAASCDFFEQAVPVARRLEEAIALLKAKERARVHAASALPLRKPKNPWQLVFVDPPFAERRVSETLEQLAERGYLATEALIYVETSRHDPTIENLPGEYRALRDKVSGDVRYALLSRGR